MHNALGQKPVNLFKAGLSQFRTGSTFKSKNVIVKTCWKHLVSSKYENVYFVKELIKKC